MSEAAEVGLDRFGRRWSRLTNVRTTETADRPMLTHTFGSGPAEAAAWVAERF
jgi:hypothetical protein